MNFKDHPYPVKQAVFLLLLICAVQISCPDPEDDNKYSSCNDKSEECPQTEVEYPQRADPSTNSRSSWSLRRPLRRPHTCPYNFPYPRSNYQRPQTCAASPLYGSPRDRASANIGTDSANVGEGAVSFGFGSRQGRPYVHQPRLCVNCRPELSQNPYSRSSRSSYRNSYSRPGSYGQNSWLRNPYASNISISGGVNPLNTVHSFITSTNNAVFPRRPYTCPYRERQQSRSCSGTRSSSYRGSSAQSSFPEGSYAARTECKCRRGSARSVYKFEVTDGQGQVRRLNNKRYQNQVLLIVVIATFHPSAPQLIVLERLQKKYEGYLKILAFPSNQFRITENGDNYTEVMNIMYYVRPGNRFQPTFDVFPPSPVNGMTELPLFSYLKSSCPATRADYAYAPLTDLKYAPLKNTDVRDAYEKFLVCGLGLPVARYDARTPLDKVEQGVQEEIQYLDEW